MANSTTHRTSSTQRWTRLAVRLACVGTLSGNGMVHAFAPSTPSTPSTPSIYTTLEPHIPVVVHEPIPSTSRYNLGVGRHGPVVSPSPPWIVRRPQHIDSTVPPVDDTATATQYLVEHQSTRDYPAPVVPIQPMQPPTPRHRHAPLIPQRLTDDATLWIRHEPTSTAPNVNAHTPVRVVARFSKPRTRNQFDVNTAWMELLIHEQQQQLSVARP